MTEIRRILYPVDFSECSRYALAHAVAIAEWYESEIIALHVLRAATIPEPPIFTAAFATTSGLPAAAGPEAVRDSLREWLEPARAAGVKTNILVDEGNPGAWIVERAGSEKADLIVMGTHGLSGFERFVLGSVVEKVLRKAACPVMTVPPDSATTASIPYRRLLCPVDFSESSLLALRFAFSLAQEAAARLTVLHVIDWPPDNDLMVARFDDEQFRQFVEQDARQRIDALISEDVRTWCQPQTLIQYGKPYRQILETAEREVSDLIVIGVRGRNPLDLTVFGSTTNHVVRRGRCPVLTLKR